MDTATPYLRVGNLVFKGKLDNLVGTDMIYAASTRSTKKAAEPVPPRYGLANAMYNKTDIGTTAMDYLDKSDTRVRFESVVLEPKDKQMPKPQESKSAQPTDNENVETTLPSLPKEDKPRICI
ncbi:hypothetical protein HDU67_006851 [Dinochytrium kinnereticum]|nr:hypothetical protein HDU67_006851 [Dinochytrium kinnereticum]